MRGGWRQGAGAGLCTHSPQSRPFPVKPGLQVHVPVIESVHSALAWQVWLPHSASTTQRVSGCQSQCLGLAGVRGRPLPLVASINIDDVWVKAAAGACRGPVKVDRGVNDRAPVRSCQVALVNVRTRCATMPGVHGEPTAGWRDQSNFETRSVGRPTRPPQHPHSDHNTIVGHCRGAGGLSARRSVSSRVNRRPSGRTRLCFRELELR